LKRGIPWSINGEEYRIDPHHRQRLGHDYDPPVAALLRKIVRPGWVCLDIGANVGVYVLQLARWCGSTGRVVAFEPNPAAREILHRHIVLNALVERVRVEHFAIGEASGTAQFFGAGADGMGRLGEPNRMLAPMSTALEVPLITLDEYCRSRNVNPNLMLLDIEGFEIAALSSARELIMSRRGQLEILVEMHPDIWASANTSRDRAESLLGELGLEAVPLTGQSDPLADHGTVRLVPKTAW
jgi:FkbM family methyltransferase